LKKKSQDIYARVKTMNRASWEYIKIQSHSKSKTIPRFIDELVEMHAQNTGKIPLLRTLVEEYSEDDLESLKESDKEKKSEK
jgi:hypothetical protein